MTVETIDLSPTLRIRIESDQDCENPRDSDCNVGTIVYTSSRHLLGDKMVSREEMGDIAHKIETGELIGIPVWAYIHSGTVIKACEANPFSCPWDSGQCGFIYCTPAKAIEEWGKKRLTNPIREKAKEYMKGEIETFGMYLGGECYGYVVERLTLDEDGGVTATEQLDACWGFLGLSYTKEEAITVGKHYLSTEATPA